MYAVKTSPNRCLLYTATPTATQEWHTFVQFSAFCCMPLPISRVFPFLLCLRHSILPTNSTWKYSFIILQRPVQGPLSFLGVRGDRHPFGQAVLKLLMQKMDEADTDLLIILSSQSKVLDYRCTDFQQVIIVSFLSLLLISIMGFPTSNRSLFSTYIFSLQYKSACSVSSAVNHKELEKKEKMTFSISAPSESLTRVAPHFLMLKK